MNTAEVNHSFGFIEMPNVHPVRKVARSTSSERVLAVDLRQLGDGRNWISLEPLHRVDRLPPCRRGSRSVCPCGRTRPQQTHHVAMRCP